MVFFVIQISQGRRVEINERNVIDSLMCGFVGVRQQTQGEMERGGENGGGVNLVHPDLLVSPLIEIFSVLVSKGCVQLILVESKKKKCNKNRMIHANARCVSKDKG